MDNLQLAALHRQHDRAIRNFVRTPISDVERRAKFAAERDRLRDAINALLYANAAPPERLWSPTPARKSARR